MHELRALVVDDDPDFRASLGTLVEREGFRVTEAPRIAEARAHLKEQLCDVVLIDLGLPDGDGLELLADEELSPDLEFIIVTGNATVESAVGALRDGALDYLTKPIDRARLKTVLTHVARTRSLKREVGALRDELRELGRFGSMVGRSQVMQEVYDLITRVAPTNASVFVVGESGTGKELVAQTVHQLSRRRTQPFLAVNCGAISPNLIESELFGHEKGSFTGADRRRHGYFEQADGGTLFLDEITEMPTELQVKLLRVLETRQVTRVGATEPMPVDVRVIAASNRNPETAVAEYKLREDLLYRLNVFPIHLPPIRAREEDVILVAQHFLDQFNAREGTRKQFSQGALEQLRIYDWPGNVRELKNAVERATILADRIIDANLLPQAEPRERVNSDDSMLEVRVGSSINEVERRLILATLDRLDGDKRQAAEVLGISLKTLYNRLNVYDAARVG
jgi:two-component system response regulator AtoC